MNDGTTIVLTYAELATRLGIELQSAKMRSMRNRWQRTRGNDGLTRVSVPISVFEAKPPAAPENRSGAILEGQEIARQEQRHIAELERLQKLHTETLERLRQDHAAELERMTAAHQSDAARLEKIIERLSRPWWARLLGSGN